MALAGAGQIAGQKAPARADGSRRSKQTADGRRNQKIERIRIEDAGNVIDEVRDGGQTQSITVQPATRTNPPADCAVARHDPRAWRQPARLERVQF